MFALLIINGCVFTGETLDPSLRVRLEGGAVAETGPDLRPLDGEEVLDLGGDTLLPGLVESHIHGLMGHDAMRGEADVRAMSRDLRDLGVAAFCPTTMSASDADTAAALRGIRAVMDRPEPRGARVLGAHAEAPTLSPAHPGAQDPAFFRDPDWEHFLRLTGGQPDTVRIVTLAPERPGSGAFIRRAAEAGILVAAGHTDADSETLHWAAGLGLSRLTHTFNAAPPLHHRAPGAVGAALTDDRVACELIPDGIHLHPDAVRLIVRCKGPLAVAITDAMEAAGLPDGRYSLGGQGVTVREGAARLEDGTLAGSVLTLPRALENLIRFGVEPLQACAMVTLNPARALGEPLLGRILPGSPAPLTRWTPDWRFAGALG